MGHGSADSILNLKGTVPLSPWLSHCGQSSFTLKRSMRPRPPEGLGSPQARAKARPSRDPSLPGGGGAAQGPWELGGDRQERASRVSRRTPQGPAEWRGG